MPPKSPTQLNCGRPLSVTLPFGALPTPFPTGNVLSVALWAPQRGGVSHSWIYLLSSPAFGLPIPDLAIALTVGTAWVSTGDHGAVAHGGDYKWATKGHLGKPTWVTSGLRAGWEEAPETLGLWSGPSRAHCGPDVWAELVRLRRTGGHPAARSGGRAGNEGVGSLRFLPHSVDGSASSCL